MKLSGWGRYPVAESEVVAPFCKEDVLGYLSCDVKGQFIARGLGRSYGDSSLAQQVIDTTCLNHFVRFDEKTGLLAVSSGVSLADILEVFVPRGWFLSVTPGTKYVTVGGAIASDVHGKNHHVHGSFTDHVTSLLVATPSAGIVECSRELNPDLFRATCGGMGLTGVVLEATIRLRPIQSGYIRESVIKARNIEEAVDVFEEYCDSTYSVAWIDCLSTGSSLGRSLVMLGEHADDGELSPGKSGRIGIPVDMPGLLLNQYSVRAFNALYYHRVRRNCSDQRVHYESFFYPLDSIGNWNRMYGRRGFCQYQFVLPKGAGVAGMRQVLEYIAKSGRGSFLAVLKVFGKGNDNYLSFPMEGYTLALDFKLGKGLFEFLDNLDQIVHEHGGRVYLAKDARMSESVFKAGYPSWKKFLEVRKRYDRDGFLRSFQSRRLGL